MEFPNNPLNNIRINYTSHTDSIIEYSINIMKNPKIQKLKFSAVGESIEKLVKIVEILKIFLPGIYQQNKIGTIAYVNDNLNPINQKLYPKLEITLLKNEPLIKNEGYQGNIPEKKRIILEEIYKEIKRKRRIRFPSRRRGRRVRRRLFLRFNTLEAFKNLNSKINAFIKEIKNTDNQNKDELFRELKSLEKNMILEIIISNHKIFKEKILENLKNNEIYQIW